MVDARKLDYAAAESQDEKKGIVLERLATFKAEGGRIVRKWQRNGMYYEVTERRQYAKTIQRLREHMKEFLDSIDRLPVLDEGDDFLLEMWDAALGGVLVGV